MAEINITSNLTPEGTTVTVDGKKTKGEITRVSFQMYYNRSINPDGSLGEECPCCRLCYETEEEMEDGSTKCVEYEYEKEGGEEMEMSDKVLIKTPRPEDIVDFFVKKMQGRI